MIRRKKIIHMDYTFKRQRLDKLTEDQLLEALEEAAAKFNYKEFGWRDFNAVGSISANPIKKAFGWKNAMIKLKDRLATKGIDFQLRTTAPNRIHSDNDMFQEMERIWQMLGHRPSRAEWESSSPRIHYNTYKSRFRGWQNACLKFIGYKMGDTTTDESLARQEVKVKTKQSKQQIITRSIPLNIRLKVLNRDSFMCVYCGRSPATHVNIQLHLDHIIPFSKGGTNTEENLQTLCQDCNLGKRDD